MARVFSVTGNNTSQACTNDTREQKGKEEGGREREGRREKQKIPRHGKKDMLTKKQQQ